jgi:hypothetical protein
MLRLSIALVATLLIVGSAILSLVSGIFFAPGIVAPLIVLLGLAFEHWRYKTTDRPAPRGFKATGERFLDPGTGKTIEVYFNQETGERRYVDQGEPLIEN